MAKIKNLKKAAARIIKAIKRKENIVIYGDSDMDGVSSVIILKETIFTAGYAGKAVCFFPDREEDGYGINEAALERLKENAPALFVALDCGIGNVKEVEVAKTLGFEVIIIDHHEVLDKVPNSIIVDPKQKGDKYPFKDFANAGLTFRLAQEVLKEKMSGNLEKSFLELAAMATVADMMPRTGENEDIIYGGMESLGQSWRPGLQALFNLEEFKDLSLAEKISKANSLMNIRDIKNGFPAAFRLLTSPDIKEAEDLAKVLIERGREKKQRIEEIVIQIRGRISGGEKIIFDGDSSWQLILLGIAASIILKETGKPVFLYKKKERFSQGSIRAPENFDSVTAMKSCSSLLETYGGHQRASGFTINNENLGKFKACLEQYLNNTK